MRRGFGVDDGYATQGAVPHNAGLWVWMMAIHAGGEKPHNVVAGVMMFMLRRPAK